MTASSHSDRSDSRLLATMLCLDRQVRPGWRPDELGPILRHQLASNLETDLGTLAPSMVDVLKGIRSENIRTFGELLEQAAPPTELLRLTKSFAKRARNDAEEKLPREIATVLYFASIACALTRRQQRITELGDHSLCRGLDWVVAQPWVDEPVRSVCQAAINMLQPSRSGEG